MQNLYSVSILHDGILQTQPPKVFLRCFTEMSLTLHIHRLHAQSGSDVREVYSETAGQVNKPDFFRKISFMRFFFYFINILF